MNYKQYTTCATSSGFFAKHQYISMTIQGLAAGGIALLLMAAAGRLECWYIAAEITVIMGILGYCHWWLEDRLICLGGDRTAIGMLVSVEGALGKDFPGNWDTDYSINLLLASNPIGAGQATVQGSTPYGYLVSSQPPITDNGFKVAGYTKQEPVSQKTCEVLHCEFEGAGVYDFMLGTQIALGLAVVALIVCLGFPGPIGMAIAAILALLAFLASLLGGVIGNFDGASPADANPNLGALHTNSSSPGGVGKGADLLVVYGTWVFDSAHSGYNEIHPIKLCERIGTWDGDWPKDIQDQIDKWDAAIAQATAPLTIADQAKPENQWEVHPVIDGCDPAAEPGGSEEPVIIK